MFISSLSALRNWILNIYRSIILSYQNNLYLPHIMTMQQNSELPEEYNNLNLIFRKYGQFRNRYKTNKQQPCSHTRISYRDHNNLPQIRSVVLRSINRPKEIWFHSDIRSSKISDLYNNKNAVFLYTILKISFK